MRMLLSRQGVPYAHQLHYMQMVTEKLARSYLADPRTQPQKTHVGFVRLLQQAKRGRESREIRRRLGYGDDRVFAKFIDSLLPLARQVEELAPVLAGMARPNPEYPWKDLASGEIVVPVDFAFPQFSPKLPQMLKLTSLVENLLAIAE